jgi:hypothetical protein
MAKKCGIMRVNDRQVNDVKIKNYIDQIELFQSGCVRYQTDCAYN